MSKKQSRNPASSHQTSTFGAGQAGSVAATNQVAATDSMVGHMRQLNDVAARYARLDPHQAKGFIFEQILAAKFNADAAAKGLSVRVEVMASNGNPHTPEDLVLVEGGKIVGLIQAKASDSATALTRYLEDEKYRDMIKVVPSDKADLVREYASRLTERHSEQGLPSAAGHADTARNVTGELQRGGASSGSTSHDEIMEATLNPGGYAFRLELQQVGQEAAVAGTSAGIAGFVLTGTISGIKNAIAAVNGEKSAGEAVGETLKDAATAGAKSSLTGASGAVIRYGAQQAGIQALTKSNVATASAAAIIEAGSTILAFAKGEISGEETAIRLGETGCSTLSGIYVGAAAGLIFGPVGAIVGSVVGYAMAAHVYQACLSILKNATLAKQEADRIEALSQAACQQMVIERTAFEKMAAGQLHQQREVFAETFDAIDRGLSTDDFDTAIDGLARVAEILGKELRYSNFSEFDAMMGNDGIPLIL